MRDYAKISPQFWIGNTGRQIRKLGIEAQLTALYLMTCPHATMLGVYYLPVTFIVHETGIPLQGAIKGLQSLCEVGFCSYDSELEYVWVHEMAHYQVGGQLKPGDNRVKGINDDYQNLPELAYLQAFFAKYQTLFYLENPRKNRTPLQDPSKALVSQEQEQDQDQEQKDHSVASTRPRSQDNPNVVTVFNHWKMTLQHPNAVLDDKRRKLIKNALKGYSVAQLCDAITGCSYTPHNMGDNDRGQRYDGLHVILRDADQIDRFIRNAHKPPRPPNPADRLMQSNIPAGQNWLNKKRQETANPTSEHTHET